MTGGTATTVANTLTTTGFGLNGGTNPAVSAITTTAGYGGDLIVASQITGGVLLDKTGLGTLTFAGTVNNTYSGQTTVDAGSLVFAMQATALAYSGVLLVYGFPGTDSVLVNSNFSQLDPNTQTVVAGNLATLDISGSKTTQTVGPLDVRGGTVNTVGANTNTLAINGTLTGLVSGGTSGTINGNLNLVASEQFYASDTAGVAGLQINATISQVTLANPFSVTKQGTGTVVFNNTAANTYTGITTVNEGTLSLTGTAVGVPSTLVVGSGQGGSGATKGNIVQLGNNNVIASTANVTINNSGLLNLNGKNQTIGTLSITGGSVTTGAGT